jgi:NAD kinase
MEAALIQVEEAIAKLRGDLQDATLREQKYASEAAYWKKRFEAKEHHQQEKEEQKKSQRVARHASPKCSMLEQDSSLHVFRRNASKLSEEYGKMQQLDTLDYSSRSSSMSLSVSEEGEVVATAEEKGGGGLHAEIMDVEDDERKYHIDNKFTFSWKVKPSRVLVMVKKTESLDCALHSAISFLVKQNIDVFLEPHLHARTRAKNESQKEKGGNDEAAIKFDYYYLNGLDQASNTASALLDAKNTTRRGSVMTWMDGHASGDDGAAGEKSRKVGPSSQIPPQVVDVVDFVVTLGGDGTVLWTSRALGNVPTPPVVPFALGSLGFMTPFPFDAIEKTLHQMIHDETKLMYRHRLQAYVRRRGTNTNTGAPEDYDDSTAVGLGSQQQTFNVLNELTIERGSSTFITNLDIYCNDSYVTNVQGDGLIISTPSGSTAYSMAAGGSIVHPEVPCLLITPICPHSLSCRPIIFPHQVRLSIQVPPEARSGVTCSFDGKDTVTLLHGDSIEVSMSAWPFRAVCNTDAVNDWITSLRSELHYNKRVSQKAF